MTQNHIPITVEVAYALPEKQTIISLSVVPGCTALEAVQQSNIAAQFPSININTDPMGIFGKKIADPKTYVLTAQERVEIYRPLFIDPKKSRLNRIKKLQVENNASA